MSIEIKKLKTSTGNPPIEKDGNAGYSIPDNLPAEAFGKIFGEILNDHTDSINALRDEVARFKTEMDSYKYDLNKQSTRNIEVIGIFSAILALLIIDTSVVRSVNSLLSATLLIVGLTASLAIFLSLVHKFFGTNDTNKLGSSFYTSIFILASLVLLGIAFDYYHIPFPASSSSSTASTTRANI